MGQKRKQQTGEIVPNKKPKFNHKSATKKTLIDAKIKNKANTYVGKKIKIRKKTRDKKGLEKTPMNESSDIKTINDSESAQKSTDGDKNKNKKSKNPLPKSTEEVSANWKKLLTTIGTGNKTKKKSTEKSSKHKCDTKTNSSEPEIWFDDVDEILIESTKPKELVQATNSKDPLVKEHSHKGLTKVVAIDCEMVGVGEKGHESNLARVSIVNQYGQCVYDTFVKSIENVTDYRTWVSGVRPQDLKNAPSFETVLQKVHSILKGRIVVGHAIHNDFKVLYLDYPKKMIRDTAKYKPFIKINGGRTPSLKVLSEKLLGVKVQEGEHSSVTDAQATMRLYTMYRKQWEKDIKISSMKAEISNRLSTKT